MEYRNQGESGLLPISLSILSSAGSQRLCDYPSAEKARMQGALIGVVVRTLYGTHTQPTGSTLSWCSASPSASSVASPRRTWTGA